MLRSDKCAGLKFHPEEHCYTIKEYGEELFKFGAARGATILVHSGDRERQPNSLQPARDQRRMRLCWDISASVARLVSRQNRWAGHSAPMDYLPFADAHSEVKLVLAHLGNSGDMRPDEGGGASVDSSHRR